MSWCETLNRPPIGQTGALQALNVDTFIIVGIGAVGVQSLD
jgi:hypothetical protein